MLRALVLSGIVGVDDRVLSARGGTIFLGNQRIPTVLLADHGGDSDRRLERRSMSSIPLKGHVPARPQDALLRTKPISQELADELAPRIMRTTVRKGRCWVRTGGYVQKTGYSYICKAIDGKKSHYLAHRILYVHYFGEIPRGYTIDHLCENPTCVNPKHLQAVTHRQNVLRSRKNPYAINARRGDVCDKGHPYEQTSAGGRRCKECARQRTSARRAERKAQGVPATEAHGTERAYHYWSCRCDECKAWQRADYLTYRAKRPGRAA